MVALYSHHWFIRTQYALLEAMISCRVKGDFPRMKGKVCISAVVRQVDGYSNDDAAAFAYSVTTRVKKVAAVFVQRI